MENGLKRNYAISHNHKKDTEVDVPSQPESDIIPIDKVKGMWVGVCVNFCVYLSCQLKSTRFIVIPSNMFPYVFLSPPLYHDMSTLRCLQLSLLRGPETAAYSLLVPRKASFLHIRV